MSDVIKIKLKGQKVKVATTSDPREKAGVVEMNDEETTRKKMEMEYERGYNDGYARGSEETEAKYEELLYRKNEEFYGILKEFEAKIEEYENSFTELVIKLAGRISRKILKREINSESVVEQIIGDALSQVIAARNIMIKVNPNDLELIDSKGELKNHVQFSKIRFEPDNSIEKGGCVIETEIGNVDARINTQIEEIVRQLELKFVNRKEDDIS